MKKERCIVCNKKTGIVPFKCKCDPNASFCSLHRLDHNCNYDYKKDQKEKLIKQNPLITPSKVDEIK